MDWSDERYVRLYTRDTATWNSLEWEGQTVLMHLLRKIDRAGVMDFEDDVTEAIHHVTRLPMHVIEAGLPRMIKKKVVEVTGQTLVFVNFIEAQEAHASQKHRAAEYRARRRDLARRGVTKRDDHDTRRDDGEEPPVRGRKPPTVTKRDAGNTGRDAGNTGRDETVTPSQAKPSLAVPPRDPSGRSTSKTVTSSQAEASHAGVREAPTPAAAATDGVLPGRPVRKRPLLATTVEAPKYEPLPEHETYAVAMGLTPGEYRTCLAELVGKFSARGFAAPERWDERLASFIESAALSKKSRPATRRGAPPPQQPKIGFDGPISRSWFGDVTSEDEEGAKQA